MGRTVATLTANSAQDAFDAPCGDPYPQGGGGGFLNAATRLAAFCVAVCGISDGRCE